jgi:hypothetical protein
MRASTGVFRGCVALTAVMVWAVMAVAQSGSGDARTWWHNARKSTSRYYNVRTDLPPDAARSLTDHMDRMCDAYQQMLSGFRVHQQFRLELWLFRSKRSYLAVLEDRYGVDGTGSGGICVMKGTQITLATWTEGNEHSRMLAVLQHEGFHQFAHAMFRAIPPWADEGLAQVFEHGVVAGDRVVVGEVPADWLAVLLAASQAQKLRPFDAFLSMGSEQWSEHVVGGDAGLNYLQAWALVHFFLYADNARYQPAFFEFLRQMNVGNSWEAAFQQAFKTRDYQALQGAFQEYLQKLRPTDLRTTLYRLEFLAEGARTLAERDTYPETIEALEAELKAIEFEHTIRDGQKEITIAASNPASFRLPFAADGEDGPRFQLLPWPSEGDDEDTAKEGQKRTKSWRRPKTKTAPRPRRIVTAGLFPRTFGIDWERDRRGRLSYQLVTD